MNITPLKLGECNQGLYHISKANTPEFFDLEGSKHFSVHRIDLNAVSTFHSN